MTDGFQRVLDHIRSLAGTQAEKGRLFERLMKAYFTADPLYRDRFAAVCWRLRKNADKWRTAECGSSGPRRR